MMLGNPPSSRRKSESADNVDDDSAPTTIKGESKEKNSLSRDRVPNLRKSRMGSKGNERAEMRILPMFSQKRVFKHWVFEIDC